MSMTIEKATSSDAAELLAYLRQVGGETDNLTFGAEGLPFGVEAEAAYLAQLEHSQDDLMVLAKENGKIIGIASLSRLPRRMAHRGDFSISVAKEYWNRGIGSRLLDAILDFAGENGFEMIDLQVRSDNAAAIHLYEKYGFRKICTYPGFLKVRGQSVDADLMNLTLAPAGDVCG